LIVVTIFIFISQHFFISFIKKILVILLLFYTKVCYNPH